MGKTLNLRVADGDDVKLREIARRVGAVAPSGLQQGHGSISQMLKRIASGRLKVVRAEGASPAKECAE